MGYENERVLEFLPWARHFARSCASKLPCHLDHDDLQSAGVLGYLKAASRYDARRGASFRGYCALRIRGAVLDELRRWDWAPRSVHKCHRRITRITSNLTEQLDREPTKLELATALGLDETDLAAYQTQAQARQVVSFDETTENEHGEENLPLTERPAQNASDRHCAPLSSKRPVARSRAHPRRHALARFAIASPGARATQAGVAAQPRASWIGAWKKGLRW